MSRRFGKDAPPTLESKRRDLELDRKKREEVSKLAEGESYEGSYKVSEKELASIKSVLGIYQSGGEGDKIDSGNVPDALRALGLNPTIGLIEKISGTVKPGEKNFSLDEFLSVYSKVKSDKDNGVYEDFIECLKLYDKQENGLMPLSELSHALSSLGEKLSTDELDQVLRDCMDEEDDEGFIPYIPFLARMCEKPVPKSIKPL